MSEPALQLSSAAINRVQYLIAEEGDSRLCLRVFVTGGGCSGFQYGFTFDTLPSEDDACVPVADFAVLIDPLSYPYLTGATVDYEENLSGARFVVKNPSATGTCGCGSSFTID